jgi:hypothetical protein
LVRVLVKPKAFPTANDSGQGEIDKEGVTLSWAEAVQQAWQQPNQAGSFGSLLENHLKHDDKKEASLEMAGKFARWSRAAEVHILSASGVNADRWHMYVGRGTAPSFEVVKMSELHDYRGNKQPTQASKRLQFWAGLLSELLSVGIHRSKNLDTLALRTSVKGKKSVVGNHVLGEDAPAAAAHWTRRLNLSGFAPLAEACCEDMVEEAR